ncbi:unnamed protein product [Fraxinus pennsylvanica]|uniref:Uncharacterized protein n=1 Tax=Fraxinus pennsylvanica TaxID=56036 RepID=A0AAD2DZF4_9LAMI|nr:unnamed protein product [Fraxinus pennsylvanica]
MRILFCKINCPFICFCKPSAAHLYTSGKLKLENAPRVPSTDFTVSDTTDDNVTGGTTKVKNVRLNGKLDAEYVPKSCIKKPSSGHDASNEIEKKKVQWKDNLGKELAEIKEFESSETWDTENEEENSHCLCVIL